MSCTLVEDAGLPAISQESLADLAHRIRCACQVANKAAANALSAALDAGDEHRGRAR